MMSSSIDLLSSSTITSNEIIQKMNNEHNDIPALLNHLSITQHSIITFLLLTSSDPPTTPPPDNTVAGDSSNLKIEQFRKVKDAFNTLKKFEDHVSHPIKVVLRSIYDALDVAASSQTQLRKLNLIVAKLKLHVSSAYIISSSASSSDVAPHGGPMWWKWNPPSSSRTPRNNCSNVFVELPNLHTSDQFLHSSAFKGIREIYDSLDKEVQCCLLCFAAFPENMIVKKRVLLYWWIGEDLLPISSTAEVEADVVLKKLMLTGFIVPVNPKRKLLVADSFKMHPFIRSAVITFAQETGRFFDFDPNNKGSSTTMNFWSCQRASCLVKLEESPGSSLVPPPPINININTPNLLEDHGKVHTLFNVSEPYLGFELDWFTKIKNVKVVYLGRWQCLPKHHIEVDNIEFLKGFKYMKHLKFFSLQGISRINELPNSICRLTNLRILDLRACHNLEVIPDGIGSLKNLTHLDMSECYLLTHMPKGIGLLSQLQVLKGFVISSDSSKSKANITTLNDLGKLKKLRKLSISASFRVFPTNKELTALQQFEALRKLTIAWGGRSFQFHQDKKDTALTTTRKLETIKTLSKTLTFKSKSVTVITTTLPMSLEKLDLRCFPRTKTPSWLLPEKLQSLKKLYIRGGNLRGFLTNDQWKVEILRLKFLGEMKMDWRQVQSLFPNLIYLEKMKCPNLTLFPCDESGVWLNENQAIVGN